MNLKLLAGRLRDAWMHYPGDQRDLARFPAGKPIFLTGTHRSGTTWAASMLADPGLWQIHEPFNPNKRMWKRSFEYAAPSSPRPDVDRYFAALLRGRHRATSTYPHTDHPLMPLRLFRPPIRRAIVKDPLACLLTGYLARHFDLDTLVLFRHPADFAASIVRLGWPTGTYLERFLRDILLMDEHLGPYALLLESHRNGNDLASAAVLHGALNRVLWNQAQATAGIRTLQFETLCRDPITQFEQLFSRLGLPYTEATRSRHQALCTAPDHDPAHYRTHAVARNSAAMADAWRRQLDTAQRATVRAIWDQFGIPLYSDPADWPD